MVLTSKNATKLSEALNIHLKVVHGIFFSEDVSFKICKLS